MRGSSFTAQTPSRNLLPNQPLHLTRLRLAGKRLFVGQGMWDNGRR